MILAALALSLALPAPAVEPLESAMALELRRASVELKEDGYPPAYFISLSVIDVDSWEQRLEMGAPYFTGQFGQRIVVPTVRAGSYELDNHPTTSIAGFQGRGIAAGRDEFAVRYGLWRMLDGAYKTATAEFLRKQAVRVSRGKTEYDTDDLTKEEPRHRNVRRPDSPWDTAALSRLATTAGSTLRREPGLLSSDATARLRRQWTRLRESDGTSVDFGRDVFELELEASTNSADGTRLYSARRFAATTPAGLPSEKDVAEAAGQMLEDLDAMAVAPTTSPFSAPTLLDPSGAQAAVVAIGLRLSGEEQRNPTGAQTFRGKMGKPVMPAGFSLVDDPTIASYKGRPLAGHYEYDDQGIPAQRVSLIEDGVLKGMLLSRYPVVGIPKSNGHGRAFAGYAPEGMPGALFLRAKDPLPQDKLLERLREECKKRGKPYGIWIKRIRGFSQQQGTSGQGSIRFSGGLVYLVDANTGALTLVRDLDLVGTPLALMGNLLAAGDDAVARDSVVGAPVSVVAPSLLFSEGELQRSESRPEKPPILPPPPVKNDLAPRRRIPFVPPKRG